MVGETGFEPFLLDIAADKLEREDSLLLSLRAEFLPLFLPESSSSL